MYFFFCLPAQQQTQINCLITLVQFAKITTKLPENVFTSIFIHPHADKNNTLFDGRLAHACTGLTFSSQRLGKFGLQEGCHFSVLLPLPVEESNRLFLFVRDGVPRSCTVCLMSPGWTGESSREERILIDCPCWELTATRNLPLDPLSHTH